MRAIVRFAALASPEQRLVVSSVLLVGATRVGLTVLPFRRLEPILAKLAQAVPGYSVADGAEEKLAWSVAAVSRYIPHATCLTQALALKVLLARHGHPSEVRIGVAKQDGQLKAHAWLERNGRILIGESGLAPFTPLDGPLPTSSRERG